MNVIFLDIDGVLNKHNPHPNGYCGLETDCVQHLCDILRQAKDTKIVLSSAWRYMILSGNMNTKGFEYILNIFGAPYDLTNGVIIGHTCSDEVLAPGATWEELRFRGFQIRSEQIKKWVDESGQVDKFVVLDDLPLEIPELIQTDPKIGLTAEIAAEVIRRFNVE